jgi:hypothetical protein
MADRGDDGGGVGFADEAVTVMRRLRSALMGLVEAAPGGVLKSRDLQKLLGIDSKLSWQLFKLSGPGDALALAPHVPSASSMRRLLEAAKDRGISKQRVEDIRAAFQSFERLVEIHAGDRTSFHSMARGLCESDDDDDTSQTDLQHRRAIFQGFSHYFGLQLQTYVFSVIVKPGSVPGRYDHASIRAKLGLRRLRADADVIVDTVLVEPPNDGDPVRQELFDTAAFERCHAAVLPEFCSRPLPQLETTRGEGGMTFSQLSGDAVGRRGVVDMVFGQAWRNAPLAVSADGKRLSLSVGVGITAPTALVAVDVLFHRSSIGRPTPEFAVYSESRRHAHQNRGVVKMPFRERIASLGPAPDAALLREMPRYTELLDYACRKLSWTLAEFDVYRVRVEYPLLDTVLKLKFDMPGTESSVASGVSDSE